MENIETKIEIEYQLSNPKENSISFDCYESEDEARIVLKMQKYFTSITRNTTYKIYKNNIKVKEVIVKEII